MRNLELLLSSSIDGLSELEGCLGLSVDYDTGRVYLATRESNVVCLDPNNQEVIMIIIIIRIYIAPLSRGFKAL